MLLYLSGYIYINKYDISRKVNYILHNESTALKNGNLNIEIQDHFIIIFKSLFSPSQFSVGTPTCLPGSVYIFSMKYEAIVYVLSLIRFI